MLQKRLHKEGSAFSQIVQQIREIGRNVDIDIQFGTVTAPLPAIEVVLDNDSMTLDDDDLTIPWQLGTHQRLTESGEVIRFRSSLYIGDRVIVACMDDKQQWLLLDKVAE
ncbi:DUF2577 family protein [Pseudobacillus sp. FSL P4-0506]|uniref:DUF2577 family protein n=1 Tax=Pseudobacillus sp. FSL P4-0506 TaxID=2921576 RepID=UPI0030F7F6D6